MRAQFECQFVSSDNGRHARWNYDGNSLQTTRVKRGLSLGIGRGILEASMANFASSAGVRISRTRREFVAKFARDGRLKKLRVDRLLKANGSILIDSLRKPRKLGMTRGSTPLQTD
jgi:hypothetical protein